MYLWETGIRNSCKGLHGLVQYRASDNLKDYGTSSLLLDVIDEWKRENDKLRADSYRFRQDVKVKKSL